MSKIIVFANQKGGVGKTTTTVNVGAYLAIKKKKILLIDFDPQGNLSSSLGISTENQMGIYESILGECSILDVINHSPQENMDIVTSNLNLSGATVELNKLDKKESLTALKKALLPVKDIYDYILIDSPPSLGVLTINAFMASEFVIIPLQCEYFALEGLKYMYSMTIKKMQKTLNPNLKIAGIVFTMYDSRTNLGKEVIKSVQSTFQNHSNILFNTVIPRNIRLTEAPSHGLPINLYDKSCIGAKSYEKLCEEVIERV